LAQAVDAGCFPAHLQTAVRENGSCLVWGFGVRGPARRCSWRVWKCLERSQRLTRIKTRTRPAANPRNLKKTLGNTDCPRAGIGRRARFRFPFSRFTAFNRVLFFRGIWDHTHPAVPPKSGTDTGGGHPQMWAGYFIIAPFIVDGAGGGLEISRAPNHDGFCC
jgi:hypothetical protein